MSKYSNKLSVRWNLGYGCHTGNSHYVEMLHRFLGTVGRNPRFATPRNERNIDVNLRVSIGNQPSYSVHRADAVEKVRKAGFSATSNEFVSKKRFLSEMRDSKIAVSPFGWGEVCYRDYEAALLGACLVKPDMGHLRTWPNIYIPFKTYVPVKWDLSNLNDRIREVLDDDSLRIRIASNAQQVLKSVYSTEGLREFSSNTVSSLLGKKSQPSSVQA